MRLTWYDLEIRNEWEELVWYERFAVAWKNNAGTYAQAVADNMRKEGYGPVHFIITEVKDGNI